MFHTFPTLTPSDVRDQLHSDCLYLSEKNINNHYTSSKFPPGTTLQSYLRDTKYQEQACSAPGTSINKESGKDL